MKISEQIGHQIVYILGMPLEEWRYKSCEAHVAVGDTWATLYDIESQEQGKGHATKLLSAMKVYYEGKGLDFGGSVSLNDRMTFIYKKCGVKEYV